MTRFPFVALVVSGVFFAWGAATVRFQVFPWQFLSPITSDVREFVKGDVSEKTGLVEKISNDLAIRPSRQLYDHELESGRPYVELQIPDLNPRRQLPEVYVDSQTPPLDGYRFVFGTFDFDSHLHGGILLDPEFRVVQQWVVDEEQILDALRKEEEQTGKKINHKPPERRLPQGVQLLPDGSMVFNDGDRGNAMHRMDFCGQTLWMTLGYFHHSIAFDSEDGSLWSFGPGDMQQLSAETGEEIRSIQLNDVHEANPGISVFTVRRDMDFGRWQFDPIHKNDIDPLTSEMAGFFPQFDAGDLLISHRGTSLLFVLDPDSLEIKWWRTGQTRRQHDPDWQPDGTITVTPVLMRLPSRTVTWPTLTPVTSVCGET